MFHRTGRGVELTEDGANLLDAKAWIKSARPVFASSAANGQYGPGHNAFTTTPDGKTEQLFFAKTSGLLTRWDHEAHTDAGMQTAHAVAPWVVVTDDQERAIESVKEDLEAPRPIFEWSDAETRSLWTLVRKSPRSPGVSPSNAPSSTADSVTSSTHFVSPAVYGLVLAGATFTPMRPTSLGSPAVSFFQVWPPSTE